MGTGAFNITRARKGLTWMLSRDHMLLLQIGTLWAAAATLVFSVMWYGFGIQRTFFHPIYLVTPFFVGALTAAALSDEAWSLRMALAAGRILYLRFFFLGVISSMLVGTGLRLFILPGLAVAILLTCAAPLLLREADGVITALSGSVSLVWRRFWRVTGLYFLVLAAAVLGVSPLFLMISFLAPFANNLLGAAVAGVVIQVISVYLGVAIYREATFEESGGPG